MQNDEFEIRFRDLLLAHWLLLVRYTTGFSARAVKTLNKSLQNLEAEVASRLVKVETRGLRMTAADRKVLNTQIKAIRSVVDDAYKIASKEITKELAEFAQDEAAFVVKALKNVKKSISETASVEAMARHEQAKAAAEDVKQAHKEAVADAKREGRKPPKQPPAAKVPAAPKPIRLELQIPTKAPNQAMIRAVLDEQPMAGRLLQSWNDKLTRDTQDAIEKAIREGVRDAKTTDQIVRKIVGTKRNRYTDGIIQASRRSMDAYVRTAVSHLHNVAAQISYAENADVVTGWRFLATMDSRTTDICIGLHGRKYPLGKGPIPPRHVRCRSICQPATLTMRELGIDVDEGTPLTRATQDGPMRGDTTMDVYLRSRPQAELEKQLGKKRAALFRAGKISTRDLVDNDGRSLTLTELRKLHPDAFD